MVAQIPDALLPFVVLLLTIYHASSLSMPSAELRKDLLTSKGPHFERPQPNRVTFGLTFDLRTTLIDPSSSPDKESIVTWLSDPSRVARAVWPSGMITPLSSPDSYRLEVQPTSFLTLNLAPTVDTLMTVRTPSSDPNDRIFDLTSTGYDPGVTVLPGLTLTEADLGIKITVAGQLRASKDGRSMYGALGFRTEGVLPGPLAILPDDVIRGAGDAVSERIAALAKENFKKEAIRAYNEWKEA